MRSRRKLITLLSLAALMVASVAFSGAAFTASSSNSNNALAANSDFHPPVVTMNAPGANLSGTKSLTATAADTGGSGVQNVKIQISPNGANTWTDVCTDSSNPYSCSLDTTTKTDGLYDFRAIATDNAGNQTTSTVVSGDRIDNTVPSATQDNPGSPLHGSVTLTGSASDSGS